MNTYKDLCQEDRTLILDKEFEKHGILRREDSKLCQKFIESGSLTIYNSPKKISRRMAEMHYLYNYTEYADILFNKFEEWKERTKDGSVYYIKPQVEAEYIALDMKPYPEDWPWI
jgi:hypothetical protein